MRNITYVVATILILGWAIGFFALHLGSSVHLVLAFALMLLILRVVQGKREEDVHE